MKLHFDEVKGTILDVKQDKRTDVYNFGKDNAFPSLLEALVGNSPTGSASVNKASKAIYGKALGKSGQIVVNKKGQTLNEVFRIASRELALHSNLYIHVGFNGEFKFKSITVIKNKDARVGKDDDKGYSGKIIAYDNWDRMKGPKVDPDDFKVYDVFNANKNVINKQIEKAGSINNYKGQVLHIKKNTNDKYSISDLNSVLAEMLLESNSQIFRSKGASKGFLNTKLLVTKPFPSEADQRNFKNNLEDVQGADNSGRVLWMETENAGDDLKSEIYLEDMSSPFQDQLFKYSDEQARKNIALAMGVPLGLIDVSDSSLFGNSGELLKEMKLQLWEEKEEDRDIIEEAFSRILSNWQDEVDEEIKVVAPSYVAEKENINTKIEE